MGYFNSAFVSDLMTQDNSWKHHILAVHRIVVCSTRTQHTNNTALFLHHYFSVLSTMSTSPGTSAPYPFIFLSPSWSVIPSGWFFNFTSISWSEHLTDLHKGFVLCFRDDEENVGCHPHTHTTEHQITERTSWHLKIQWKSDIKSPI